MSQQRQRPAGVTVGRRRAADGHQRRLGFAVKFGRSWRAKTGLALQRRLLPITNEFASGPRDGVDVNVQRGGNLLVLVSPLRVILVAHQQNARMRDTFGLRATLASNRLQPLPLLRSQANGHFASAIHGDLH